MILTAMGRWTVGDPVPSHDEIIAQWGPSFLMYRRAWSLPNRQRDDMTTIGAAHEVRRDVVAEFGFPLPSRELVTALADHQPIVEIGAGSGFMTAVMRANGIDAIGTDPVLDYLQLKHGRFDPLQQRIAGKTAVRRYRDRTVFCSWPSLDHTWFRQALRAMRIGQRIIMIMEDSCADQTAWVYRDACFERESMIPIPAWPFMNDDCAIWIKKRHRAISDGDEQ